MQVRRYQISGFGYQGERMAKHRVLLDGNRVQWYHFISNGGWEKACRTEEKRMSKKLEEYVLTIPDFPEPGIMFRDITSVIQDPDGLKLAIDGLADLLKNVDFDLVVGPESRGFIFGVPVAFILGKGFIPVRKKGKLPRETVSQKYDLEYGQAEIEIHKDAIQPGQKVVIVDDLIATGGSAEAAAKLVEKLGGKVVRMVFVMELAGLEGRKKLEGYDVESLIIYPGK